MSSNVVQLKQPLSYEPIQIPPAAYTLAYDRHTIVKRFDRGVLEVWFVVKDFGEHFGKALPRYYNVQPSSKGRGFTTKNGADFVRDYCTLFGRRPKFNQAPMHDFRDVLIRAKVETVSKDYQQRPLPAAMRYSVVRELLSVERG